MRVVWRQGRIGDQANCAGWPKPAAGAKLAESGWLATQKPKPMPKTLTATWPLPTFTLTGPALTLTAPGATNTCAGW